MVISSKELGKRLLKALDRHQGKKLGKKNKDMLRQATNLIQKGADLSRTNRAGQTTLIVSIINGYADVAAVIVEKGGVGIDCRDKGLNTALIFAVTTTVELVELLLDNNADITASNDSGNTALHRACAVGKPDMVTLLLKRKAPLEAINAGEETPIFEAVKAGRRELCDLLLAGGANLFALNTMGQGVLHTAAAKGNLSIYRHLRDVCGASEDLLDVEGMSPSQLLSDTLARKKLEKECAAQWNSQVPTVALAGGSGNVEQVALGGAIGESIEENEDQIDVGAGMGEVERYKAIVADLQRKVEEKDEFTNTIYQQLYDVDKQRIKAENDLRDAEKKIECLQQELVKQHDEGREQLYDLMNRLEIAEKAVRQASKGAGAPVG